MRRGFMGLCALLMILATISCSSSRYQNGFVYRPAQQGPGFSGSLTEATASDPDHAIQGQIAGSVIAPPPTANMTLEPVSFTQSAAPSDLNANLHTDPLFSPKGIEEAKATELARLIQVQLDTKTGSAAVDPQLLVRNMATDYATANGTTLSDKQLRKLDKYAAKLGRKQQKNTDIDWAPENNLEIFILAAAGVGIIVGLFAGIGWLVFIVAALAYLYLKLLA